MKKHGKMDGKLKPMKKDGKAGFVATPEKSIKGK